MGCEGALKCVGAPSRVVLCFVPVDSGPHVTLNETDRKRMDESLPLFKVWWQ